MGVKRGSILGIYSSVELHLGRPILGWIQGACRVGSHTASQMLSLEDSKKENTQ